MVDALEAVWRVLRPNGLVFDLQPDASHRPAVAVRDARGRRTVGTIARAPDEDVVAAHAARERLVASGRFRTIAVARRTYRASFDTIAAFEASKRSHTPTWRLAPGTLPRLRAAWRTRRGRAAIESTRRMTIVALRKTDRSR